MPASGRNGRDEYLAAHIPGARFLDIDEVADKAHPAPHMLPAAADFGDAMESSASAATTGSSSMTIRPTRNAARGWFMFRHFGARDVAILDGGFQKWLAEGRPTESGEPAPRGTTFEAKRPRRGCHQAADARRNAACRWLDARGKPRFEGSDPDPRAGVAPGTSPDARNLPFASLYREDGTFRPVEELRRLFAEAGVDPSEAVRRQLRLRSDRQQPDLRGAPNRQRRDPIVRRKLERVGRRPGNAEGVGPSLGPWAGRSPK